VATTDEVDNLVANQPGAG
jgi:hypothetical protein